jgi:phospholipid transport system substrate-binding protein
MKKIIMVIVLILSFNLSLSANYTEDIENNFLKKMEEVVQIINKNEKTRNKDIVNLITPMFDFKLMSKLSIGKKWKKLLKDERESFTIAYVQRMKNIYSSKLDEYENQIVLVKEIKTPKKNRVFLVTDIKNKKNNFEIIYKYYKPKKQLKNKNEWLIYDVEIEGVSILKTDKMQFRDFLSRNSFQDLIDNIKDKE